MKRLVVFGYSVSLEAMGRLLEEDCSISNILDHTVFGRHDLNMAQIEIPIDS